MDTIEDYVGKKVVMIPRDIHEPTNLIGILQPADDAGDYKILGEDDYWYVQEACQVRLAEEDLVNHPPHYTSHPSGIECIQITEHMSFNLGNALKYIWRADLKGNAVQDLEKAKFYIERELSKRAANDE